MGRRILFNMVSDGQLIDYAFRRMLFLQQFWYKLGVVRLGVVVTVFCLCAL